MKTNLDRNFSKYISSKVKAIEFVNNLAKKYNDEINSYTSHKYGRSTIQIYGETINKTFEWDYDVEEKRLNVYYIDGRPEPENVKPEKSYYIIWIEGISPKQGEKIKSFKKDGTIEYTTSLADALRVLPEDLPVIKEKLRKLGMANWIVDNPETYVLKHNANKNNIFRA